MRSAARLMPTPRALQHFLGEGRGPGTSFVSCHPRSPFSEATALREDGSGVKGPAGTEEGAAAPFIAVQPFPALLDLPLGSDAVTASCGSRHTAVVTSECARWAGSGWSRSVARSGWWLQAGVSPKTPSLCRAAASAQRAPTPLWVPSGGWCCGLCPGADPRPPVTGQQRPPGPAAQSPELSSCEAVGWGGRPFLGRPLSSQGDGLVRKLSPC